MWAFTLLSMLPAIGGFIAGMMRAFFWIKTMRAPKNRPEAPDDVPRSTQEIVLRFSSEKKTRGSSFLAQGFNHVTEYIYVEDSQDKVGQHEWVRRQRIGPCVRTSLVRQKDRDLAAVLARVEGVTVITTKIRLPTKRPWRPRLAFSPGGAGIVKTDMNLHDGWLWTPHDIYEVERAAPSTRNKRIYALRNRKLRGVFGLCLVSYLAQWLAWEEPIVALALMLAVPALAFLLHHIWVNGMPSFGRVMDDGQEELVG